MVGHGLSAESGRGEDDLAAWAAGLKATGQVMRLERAASPAASAVTEDIAAFPVGFRMEVTGVNVADQTVTVAVVGPRGTREPRVCPVRAARELVNRCEDEIAHLVRFVVELRAGLRAFTMPAVPDPEPGTARALPPHGRRVCLLARCPRRSFQAGR
ncbi:hypothetical protein C3Y87_14830 [Carbonactinospora thermoautotrophica]|uniref:hypothetical protein n=1 Tax=Carbonactinospora thermoautotrophica TaxID=1469144 RepID=UPI0022717A7E|nr:hypothetical protein [Carbonactinospora thermoautotrophica]MCX9192665.1 hypothetical protein [Carbonactinospora thermoautotrophica]